MARTRRKTSDHPFDALDRLLKQKRFKLPNASAPAPEDPNAPPLSPQQEEKMFKSAMADVKPISSDRYWQLPSRAVQVEPIGDDEEREALEALQRLIDSGEGFVVSDTAEYMEATGPGVGAEVTRRLHGGHYSVQDYIDLHGLSAEAADQAFHRFIRAAIENGQRAVLVVHGRGLTSPVQPVLKNKVFSWLTRGPLRKHVIAFTSARSCDGGSGATYILLRVRPLAGKRRKQPF